MTFKPDHEIYKRRFSRNLGVGLLLAAFVVLSFFLTVEKVTHGDPMGAVKGTSYDKPAETKTAMNRANRTAGWLALVALVMVSLSFAAVPFYRWFCQTTGLWRHDLGRGSRPRSAAGPDDHGAL